MLIAITREVSPSIEDCELTFLERQWIQFDLAQAQHRQYEQCLQQLGCEVQRLPVEPSLPDSVFIEDTALVVEEVALMTRPGAASRRPETASVAQALSPYRTVVTLQAPATLDGGDVLVIGRSVYIGLSRRSNQSAIEQVQTVLRPYGYTVCGVPVHGCLHLKSAATQIAPDALLINRHWLDSQGLGSLRMIEVDEAEPHAANALLIGETVIYPSGYPRTQQRLEDAGIRVQTVDVSELIKAEGAVTCCSLVFNHVASGSQSE